MHRLRIKQLVGDHQLHSPRCVADRFAPLNALAEPRQSLPLALTRPAVGLHQRQRDRQLQRRQQRLRQRPRTRPHLHDPQRRLSEPLLETRRRLRDRRAENRMHLRAGQKVPVRANRRASAPVVALPRVVQRDAHPLGVRHRAARADPCAKRPRERRRSGHRARVAEDARTQRPRPAPRRSPCDPAHHPAPPGRCSGTRRCAARR